MTEFPALPVFTDAYLQDCSHLTDAEHGRYFLLLMLIWRSPQTRVPNDDAWLAKHLHRTPGRVKKEIRPIIEEFCQNNGNFITQKRLKKEKAFVRKYRKSQSVRSKARWDKEKGASPRISHGTPTASPRHSPGISHGKAPHPTQPHPKEELNSNSDDLGNGIGQLDPDVYDRARAVAPGYDVQALEKEWRTWTRSTGAVIQYPERAFIAFCKKHSEANPI